jgi:hypothetical protein
MQQYSKSPAIRSESLSGPRFPPSYDSLSWPIRHDRLTLKLILWIIWRGCECQKPHHLRLMIIFEEKYPVSSVHVAPILFTPSPTISLRDGPPFESFGAAGCVRWCQTYRLLHAQTFQHVLGNKLGVSELEGIPHITYYYPTSPSTCFCV